jgi:ATP-dependent helicase HrpB
MLLIAGRDAAPLAALLADRDPLIGAPADLSLRLKAVAGATVPYALRREALDRIRAEAKRLARMVPEAPGFAPAEMAALAYPDRIGQRRDGAAPRYLLSGGKGAVLAADDPLGTAPWIVATDLDGDPREARIRQALPLTEGAIRALYGERIALQQVCAWDARAGRIVAARRECLGALVLSEQRWDAPPEARARAALEGLRALGLGVCGMTGEARRLQARVALLRGQGVDLPDLSDAGILARAEDWLLPWLTGVRTAADLRALDLTEALRGALDWEQAQDARPAGAGAVRDAAGPAGGHRL